MSTPKPPVKPRASFPSLASLHGLSASCEGSGCWVNPSFYRYLLECPIHHTVVRSSLTVASASRTDREPCAAEEGTRPCPAQGRSDVHLEVCSRRAVLAGGCVWGSLVPADRGLATYLSAWRRLSGRRCRQAACRCRAPGSRRSQRASGRSGTGCRGRSATGGGREVAAVPASSLAQPWPGTPSQSQPCHHSVLTLLRAPAPRSLCHTQAQSYFLRRFGLPQSSLL